MLGSVFSPFYARAHRRGDGDPLAHAAVNLALYDLTHPGGSWLGPLFRRQNGDHWCLTEGGRVARNASSLWIGDTRAAWDGAKFTVDLEERTAPIPAKIRGRLVVEPAFVTNEQHAIDAEGRHLWWPIAPFGRISVRFDAPQLSWSGPAYFDSNAGDEPLSAGFSRWTWSRMTSADRTVVVYDPDRRDGSQSQLRRAFHRAGSEDAACETTLRTLPSTRWRIHRSARTEVDAQVAVGRTLEDTPFYARTHLVGTLDGKPASGVHEVVDLDRFDARWVQNLLPYRMRRVND